MKKRVNLSIEEKLYKNVKRTRKNVSRYVEKLVIKDILARKATTNQNAVASNGNSLQWLPGAIYSYHLFDDSGVHNLEHVYVL